MGSISWLRVRNWEEPDQFGTPIHEGLLLEIEIEARDADEALRKCIPTAGLIVDFLVQEAAAHSQEPRPLVLYEVRDGGEFRQYLDQKLPGTPTREAESARVLNRISLHVDLSPEHQNAVAQAQRWYREGMRQSDPIDRFLHFIIGLEALEKPLREVLGPDPHVRTCQKCGHQERTRKAVGISKWLDDEFGEGTSGKLFRLRAQIVHPGKNFAELRTQASARMEVLEAGLYRGLQLVLRPDEKPGEYKVSLEPRWPFNVVVTAELAGPVERLLSRDTVPILAGDEPITLSSSRNEDGSTTITASSKLAFNVPDGIQARNIELHLPAEAWEGVQLNRAAARILTDEEAASEDPVQPPWLNDPAEAEGNKNPNDTTEANP